MAVNICNGNGLCGYKAAKALEKYINRLEKRKVKGLTETQVNSLLKTARVLRTAVVQSSGC